MKTFHVDEPREIGKKRIRVSRNDLMQVKDNLTEDNLDMWFDFKDRHFMANVLFPTIGKYLENKESKRVLDIGIESYNLAD